LRTDPAFVELLRLARVVNSLAANHSTLLTPLEDQSPKARRDRFAAFFYVAALLQEGLHTAQSLGRYFRELPQYGFGAILVDPDVADLRSGDLDQIRDRLVFHFDRHCLQQGLARFPDGKTVIATAPAAWVSGEIYFDIADDALVAYLYGDAPTEAEYLARLGRLMDQVATLFQRFMRASHTLIPAALQRMGCHSEPFARPPSPTDAAV
jgi:hypothetical protein